MPCKKCDQPRVAGKSYCQLHACPVALCPHPAAKPPGRCAKHSARQSGSGSGVPIGRQGGTKPELRSGPSKLSGSRSGGGISKSSAPLAQQDKEPEKGKQLEKESEKAKEKDKDGEKEKDKEKDKQPEKEKLGHGGAGGDPVQAILAAWAGVHHEDPGQYGTLFANVAYTRFFIHAERAIETEVDERQVNVSGGHYCVVIRDRRDDHQNVGYLVDTHAENPVVQLDDLAGFLGDLAAGTVGDGAFILALRPRIGDAPAPRQGPLPSEQIVYTNHQIGDQNFPFLDFRNNNCGAVATLGVGCLPPDDTYNFDRAPYHEIHRFLPALLATYTIRAAYRPPTVIENEEAVSEQEEFELAWKQFLQEMGGRCEAVSFQEFVQGVIASRRIAQLQEVVRWKSVGQVSGFVHRWGCIQLVVRQDGSPAPYDKLLRSACRYVTTHAFPIAYSEGTTDLQSDLVEKDALGPEIDVAVLAERGLRLLAIPQSLFELILLMLRPIRKGDSCQFSKLEGHPGMTCGKDVVTHPRFINRKTQYKMANKAFLTYANQAVVGFLCDRWKDRGLPVELDIEQWLEIANDLLAAILRDKFSSRHLLSAAGMADVVLRTIRLEHELCGEGGPGFQLYRVTTEFTEESSLTRHEISYGASLFAGWIFDGPQNGTKSACVMAYVMGGGAHHNYYMLRIRREDWQTRTGKADYRRRLRTLTLPPVPICLQLFGFQGGFHPRMAKTEIAGIGPLSVKDAIAFMRLHHRSYNALPVLTYGAIPCFPPRKIDKLGPSKALGKDKCLESNQDKDDSEKLG